MTFEQQNNTQAIIDVAVASTEAEQLEEGMIYAIPVPSGGDVKLIDLNPDDRKPHPRRKTGTVAVHSGASFCEYLDKHGVNNTEIYADAVSQRIIGVVNAGHASGDTDADGEGEAGWADHRVVFNVIATKSWKDWLEHDGESMKQEAFAEFIEDHLADIIDPAAADMLEVAQSIQATIGTTFQSSKRLSSGETQFEYREDMTATAGGVQRLEIPQVIVLAIAPFEGSDTYRMEARFRYRLNGGNLTLSYKLTTPENQVRDAFAGVTQEIREGASVPVFDGVPAGTPTIKPLAPSIELRGDGSAVLRGTINAQSIR